MGRNGLLIGEVAAKSGVSRKALRLYEAAGILPASRRTASGYRVYDPDALAWLSFVTQARRLGFGLREIREITVLKRSGQSPCAHIRGLVRSKIESIEQALTDLGRLRRQLQELERFWPSRSRTPAAVCPCIERLDIAKERR